MSKDEVYGLLMRVPGMTEELAGKVFDAGFSDKDRLFQASISELEAIDGVDFAMANNIQSIARKGVLVGDVTKEEETEGEEVSPEEKGSSPMDSVLGIVTGLIGAIVDIIKKVIGSVTGGKEPEAAADSASEGPAEPTPPEPPAEPKAPAAPGSPGTTPPEAPTEGAVPPGTPQGPTPEQAPEPAPESASAPAREPEPEVASEPGKGPVTEPPEEQARETSPEPPAKSEVAPTTGVGDSLEATVAKIRNTFDIDEDATMALIGAGFTEVEKIRGADLIQLAEIDGITLAVAKKIKSA